jgi:HD-GYP domain-containing protein (c-di-GMP phosphodiesterase class II)/DNA-binding CsgD family transcriptional regulator
MDDVASSAPASLPVAEVVAALSLATDLGTGQPLERGLHATLLAMRMCDRLGVDEATATDAYFQCLLMYVGCTADADRAAEVFADDIHHAFLPAQFGDRRELAGALARAVSGTTGGALARTARLARGMPRALATTREHLVSTCEVARMLGDRLGLPARVCDLFDAGAERWDGAGGPRGLRGEQVPLPVRIAQVARDATFHLYQSGRERTVASVRERAGAAFDPTLAELLAGEADQLLAGLEDCAAWDEVLARDPSGLTLDDAGIDRALAAIGTFADLVSPAFTGHSAAVAALAAGAAEASGFPGEEVVALRRAGLVHDVGRVAVRARVWNKQGPLTTDERERARLHPYYTERVLVRSRFLATLAPCASAHHERLDGSGYHRGIAAPALPRSARFLAAADAFRSRLEPRGHRPALSQTAAAEQVVELARAGRLDPDAVSAVVTVAGVDRPALPRPAGLTERESQVLGLLASGLSTKQVARRLGISTKTADRHVQNTYTKIGVSSRAAATVFAMQHGLSDWGEFPMGRAMSRS